MIGTFLKGKTALVTGSLSGIGLGIAKSLSGAGANVVLNGFASDEDIHKLQKELTTQHSKAKFIFADLTKPKDSQNLVKQSIKHFGQVDILVNNAGIQHISETHNFPDQMWEKIIALMLSSAFYTTKHTLPGMIDRKWGRILNIASVHGLVASVNKSAYVSAKHGLVGFSKTVALENATNGITSNTICPGFVLTPLIQKQIQIKMKTLKCSEQQGRRAMTADKQPTQEFCKPEDVGALALFLCSESARQCTGATYTMDGGWTAQ